MMTYKLRPYTDTDFEFVYQAKKDAYKKYVEEYWGTWDEDKQRALFNDFINKVQNTLSIIEHKGISIGLYHGNMMDQNTYEIGNIIVIPSYQGHGIGSDILLSIFQQYPQLKMYLQVFKSNPAVNLYKRLSFTITDETRTHYMMERK